MQIEYKLKFEGESMIVTSNIQPDVNLNSPTANSTLNSPVESENYLPDFFVATSPRGGSEAPKPDGPPGGGDGSLPQIIISCPIIVAHIHAAEGKPTPVRPEEKP